MYLFQRLRMRGALHSPLHTSSLSYAEAEKQLEMKAFWDVAPCSLGEVYRRFRGAYCLHHHSRPDDVVCTSVTSVYLTETTRRYIPDGGGHHDAGRRHQHYMSWPVLQVSGNWM
jgi:hypothetical protein